MDNAIELSDFSKHFGPVVAVDGITLTVRRGEIYGFVGLNGAGKTTTIRALLGMIHPTEGSIRLLGREIGKDGRGPWARVGHLVESPAAYPDLSVRENLEIARRLHGLPGPKIVDQTIEKLGLDAYTQRKAGKLSTGNLQRLGLARALLHAPDLLILDEPANGLDPAGVVEIRQLLEALARGGVTVFMSSHILTEVDRLATRIGIIHKGRLIEELDSEKIEQVRARKLAVQARDLEAARSALLAAGYLFIQAMDAALLIADPRAVEAPDEVARLLVNAGAPPTRLAVEQETLEEHFLRLTGVFQ